MKLPVVVIGGLLFLCLPCSLPAHAKTGKHTLESAHKFVQTFYDWYVPKALSDSSTPPFNYALRTKSSDFSPQLAKALRQDAAAKAKAGEIVGIDFDPFLNSQDPGNHYYVRKISRKGESYRAAVYGVRSPKKDENPDVVAVLIQQAGHWQFVNFLYPDNGGDLLTILKFQRESREHPIAAPPTSAFRPTLSGRAFPAYARAC